MSNIEPFILNPGDIYGRNEKGPLIGDGINNLPSFLSQKDNELDSDLKYLEDLENTPYLNLLFDKPRLDNKWIDDFKKKIKWQENYDFDTFVTSVTGSTTNKQLKLLESKFPDILKKKEIPPLSNIELHNKIAKLLIRGIRSEEDYLLTYMICSDKIKYNNGLLMSILSGIGYTSDDRVKRLNPFKEEINGPLNINRNYEGPPKRIPELINPLQIQSFQKDIYNEAWGKNKDRFNSNNQWHQNPFGQSFQDENRYQNNYFLNMLK